MKIRRIAITTVSFLLLGILISIYYKSVAQNAGVTFTLEQKSSLIDFEGNFQASDINVIAFRGDGSNVHHRSSTNGEPILSTITLAPQMQTVFSVKRGIMSTTYLPAPVAPLRLRGNDCTNVHPPDEAVIETSLYLGVSVVRVKGRTPLGPPNTVGYTESWLAPDLDCRYLYRRVEWKHPDGRVAQLAETITLNLAMGDPDPKLFILPTNLAEVKTSDFLMEQDQARARELDKRYYKYQTKPQNR